MTADLDSQGGARIRLSICIATFKRADFIGQTIESVLPQLRSDVELVVVDGCSPDSTADVMAGYVARHPGIRYIREPLNSGIDQDYDKAVGYARGDFCWLMTDDDLMVKDAVQRVLAHLENVDVVVVNAEVRTKDLSTLLRPRLLEVTNDLHFDEPSGRQFFAQAADYLSFIGGVVVRRAWWMRRDRASYYGTLFVHVGALFQAPAVARAHVIAKPLLVIRFGNAMWSARSFEIWMFKWPALIWSFQHFSSDTRAAVSSPYPYLSAKRLLWFRAIGGYTISEYKLFLAPLGNIGSRLIASSIARLPARAANFLCALYYMLRTDKSSKMELYDLSRSVEATSLARRAAALRHLP